MMKKGDRYEVTHRREGRREAYTKVDTEVSKEVISRLTNDEGRKWIVAKLRVWVKMQGYIFESVGMEVRKNELLNVYAMY